MKPLSVVHIENRQRLLRLNPRNISALTSFFLQRAARLLPPNVLPWSDVTVILVADRGSAKAHREVFNDPTATDVITLPYLPEPGIHDAPSGELIVNVQRAFEEGSRRASTRPLWSPHHELALYLAHGCDHLTGADDFEDADFHRMRSRELRWLKAAPLDTLLHLFQA